MRIPLGHWIFGPPYPYHRSYGANPHPFVDGGIDVLDRAMDWAAESGLRVVLDLHAAPGCQNGFDNGGIQDVCEWHTRHEYLAHSVEVLDVSRRVIAIGHPARHPGVERAARGRTDGPAHGLLPPRLSRDSYRTARRTGRGRAPRRFPLVPRVPRAFPDPGFVNVLFDVHRYQCFERADIDMDIHGHLHKAGRLWKDEALAMQRDLGVPAIAGEWSLGLDLKVVSLWAPGPYNHALDRMDAFQEHVACRGYGAAQLLGFEQYRGWFFWSYRTETTPAWSFRDSVERGWLPDRFQ